MRESGERVVADTVRQSETDLLVYLEHIATYQFAQNYTKDAAVLDFGCGTGYGSDLLSKTASSVQAVDVSNEAITYAQTTYKNTNLTFSVISPLEEQRIPFPDESFDIVTSFQVIEHIQDTDLYLQEIRRVLKRGGIFIFATPDRTTRLFSFQQPWNVFHEKEFSPTTLKPFLKKYYQENSIDLYGVTAVDGLLLPELRRSQILKFVSLPFTLPFMPRLLRRVGLNTMKFFNNLSGKISKKKPVLPYTISDVTIKKNTVPSLDIIGICTKE